MSEPLPPNMKSIDGLNYALKIVRGRRVLNRTPDYLAALNEIEIFLMAAIERVENGEPMGPTATVSSNDEDKS